MAGRDHVHTDTLLYFPDFPAKSSGTVEVRKLPRVGTDTADPGLAVPSLPGFLQGVQLACNTYWPDRS